MQFVVTQPQLPTNGDFNFWELDLLLNHLHFIGELNFTEEHK